ncbi:GRRM system radical SAM/SPASM domain protein [Rhizobium laguerreae]|uniref:cyclophane-forming radical SAM/SPASM peptide maturase GrrM/OscB n=1 Tax=Rhizobium laguerreae TaxID=1076926 RepID=UPI001C904A13|nr:cyclophane-forming radical SAM/SPASM peptide maturase GrrM/OscB [Rhizobium laguerreae]MBY3181037.1 GRRM system radical SAM/SPASM domain protein [Rhizobium laguerreae]
MADLASGMDGAEACRTLDKGALSKFFGSTQLLVLQPTTQCNLNCGYCYLGHRMGRNVMSQAVVENIAANLCKSRFLHSTLEVSFHSGEPLLVGTEWFKRTIDTLSRSWRDGTKVVYSVQTNGTLINEEWIELFRRYDIRVSISLDGPPQFNDVARPNWGGRGSCDKVLRGIGMLNKAKIPFAILCVLTDKNILFPDVLFEFFQSLGPTMVGFNIEEIEGANIVSKFQSVPNFENVSQFLKRYLFRCDESRHPHRVREIEHSNKLFSAGIRGRAVKNDCATPFRIVSVNYAGGVSTFSPELSDVVHSRLGDFIIADIEDGPPEEMLNLDKFQVINSEIQDGVRQCEAQCAFFRVCGGGAPANKLAEWGTFAVAETAFCRSSIMPSANLVLESAIEKLTRS